MIARADRSGRAPEAEAVRASQQAWGQALVARDIGALQSLLATELVYVHSTGVRHDRAAYLQFAETGPAFLSVEVTEATVQVSGDLAVLGGMLSLTLHKAGLPQPQSLRSIVTQVWRRGPDAWQLLRAQATRPAEANPS